MGMDVFGTNGNYFRANIWQWRALCYAIELAGYEIPDIWYTNSGEGLETQKDCNTLADRLQKFLNTQGDRIKFY